MQEMAKADEHIIYSWAQRNMYDNLLIKCSLISNPVSL